MTPRRFFSIGAVVLLHVALIWALATGLAANLMQKAVQDVQVAVVQEKPPEHKLPPPPPPQLVKPPPPDVIPPPEINVQTDVTPPTTITQVSNTPAPPQPAATKPAGITAPVLAAGAGNNCLSRYYPAMAIRLNHEGATTVKIDVSADGKVDNVSVAESTGHDELDQAAIQCVTNGWHFKPAMQNGAPVGGSKEYKILWKLAG